MFDKIFCCIFGGVLSWMAFLILHACFISVIAMHPSVNTNTFDQGYALFTTKYWTKANTWQPAKLHMAGGMQSPTKKDFKAYQRERDEYAKKHRPLFSFRTLWCSHNNCD